MATLKEKLANQNPEIQTVESGAPMKVEKATVDEKQTAGFDAGKI